MDEEKDNSEKVWYLEVNGKPAGPYSANQVRNGLTLGKVNPDWLLFGPNMNKWEPVSWHPAFNPEVAEKQLEKLPQATFHQSQLVHDVDFEIFGDDMQFVEIELDPGEAVFAEAGAMMFMDDSIAMETVFGDGSQSGAFEKLLGAGKRVLTGESLFMTTFTNAGEGKKCVSLSAPYPGKIIPINLPEVGGELICQKDAFLCAAKGVAVDIFFQKRIGVALFGGEGFIMQRLQGDGLAFIHAGGTLHNIQLEPGQRIKVDTGCLVAMESQVNFEIEFVGGIKSAFFGGEGFFFATIAGPGNVWLQSMPFSRLAARMLSGLPAQGGKRTGEGSLLDTIGSFLTD